MKEDSEKAIQDRILEYLNLFEKGFVSKIEIGGMPVRVNKNIISLRPFRNRYHRRYMSDIYFLKEGVSFWFEVKRQKEGLKISEKFKNDWARWINLKSNTQINGQYNFLEEVIANGAYGGFVCCIEDVRDIIINREYYRNKVFIPFYK